MADSQPSRQPSLVIPPDGGRSLAAWGGTLVFKLEGSNTGGTLSGFEEFYTRFSELSAVGGTADPRRQPTVT